MLWVRAKFFILGLGLGLLLNFLGLLLNYLGVTSYLLGVRV